MIPYKLGRYHLAFQLCIARSQIFAIVCEKPRRRDVNIFAQNLGISGDPCNGRSIFNFAKWQVMSKFFGVFLTLAPEGHHVLGGNSQLSSARNKNFLLRCPCQRYFFTNLCLFTNLEACLAGLAWPGLVFCLQPCFFSR